MGGERGWDKPCEHVMGVQREHLSKWWKSSAVLVLLYLQENCMVGNRRSVRFLCKLYSQLSQS